MKNKIKIGSKIIDSSKDVFIISEIGTQCTQFIIILDNHIPHINLVNHPWRRLKTKVSNKKYSSIGASLWAAKRVIRVNNQYAFPRYTNETKCNANSASNGLNKWLKPRIPNDCVIHSFRHSLRDRLSEVQCP